MALGVLGNGTVIEMDPNKIAGTVMMNSTQSQNAAGKYTAQQWYTIQAFRSQTYIQDQVDVQNEPIYDTIRLTTPTTTLNATNNLFFDNVGSASAKGIDQTNLSQNRVLQAPQALAIFSYRIYVQPQMTIADIVTTLELAYQFKLGEKFYQTAPSFMLPQGGGISGGSTQSYVAVTSGQAFTNGWPSHQAVRTLALTLVIENNANFVAYLNGGQIPYTFTSTVYRVMNVLDGLHARGIQ